MDWVKKFIVPASLPVLIFAVLPSSLSANTVYTYTGVANGSYQVEVSFTVASPLIGLAPLTDISGDLIGGFTISDGVTPPPQDNAGFPLGPGSGFTGGTIDVGTDSLGNVTSWNIFQTYFASYPAFSGENPNDFYCNYKVGTSSSGGDATSLTLDNDAGFCPANSNSQSTLGTWAPNFGSAPSVPEPASCLTLVSGLIGVAAVAIRRKRA